jgi:hypothetical protein
MAAAVTKPKVSLKVVSDATLDAIEAGQLKVLVDVVRAAPTVGLPSYRVHSSTPKPCSECR